MRKIYGPFRYTESYECCNLAQERAFHDDLNGAIAHDGYVVLYSERAVGKGVAGMLLLEVSTGVDVQFRVR